MEQTNRPKNWVNPYAIENTYNAFEGRADALIDAGYRLPAEGDEDLRKELNKILDQPMDGIYQVGEKVYLRHHEKTLWIDQTVALIKSLEPQKECNPMNVIPSETIYSNGELVIPMADVQHIEKKYYSQDMVKPEVKKGDLMGISVVTRHTRWDMDADVWANNIWIGRDKAEEFIKAWCYFRYEIDGVKAQMEANNDR